MLNGGGPVGRASCRPTGSIRISFGYMSSIEDAEKFLEFVAASFREDAPPDPALVKIAGGPAAAVATEAAAVAAAVFLADRVAVVVDPAGKEADAEGGGEDRDVTQKTKTDVIASRSAAVNRATAATARNVAALTIRSESDGANTTGSIGNSSDRNGVRLQTIAVFPIKSCGAYNALSWEIGATGLAYDRHWLVLDQYGSCITQKQVPNMCLIQPTIELSKGTLTLAAPGAAGASGTVTIPLEPPADTAAAAGTGTTRICRARVCFDVVNGIDCGDGVAAWQVMNANAHQTACSRLHPPSVELCVRAHRCTSVPSVHLHAANLDVLPRRW